MVDKLFRLMGFFHPMKSGNKLAPMGGRTPASSLAPGGD